MAEDQAAALPQVRPPGDMPDRYYDLYCAAGRMRLSQVALARRWYALGVPPETAGAWSRYGFTPEVGWKWMCEDATPEIISRLDEEARRR